MAIPLLNTDTLGKIVQVETCVITSTVALLAMGKAGNNINEPHVLIHEHSLVLQ